MHAESHPPMNWSSPHLQPARADARYDSLARFLHWIFAAGILYASLAGYILTRMPEGAPRAFLSQFNMSITTVLIVLFPLRLFWKFARPQPADLPGVSGRQHAAAHGVHGLIYLCTGAALASGYLMVPHGYRFFGLFEIPTPFAQGPLTVACFAAHRAACAALVGLVALHVLAVVQHQCFARRDVLSRML
jgi:superoxide oxidase